MTLPFEPQTATIAISGTESGEVDLKSSCDLVRVQLPTLTSCQVYVKVALNTGGTFQELGDGSNRTDTTTGAYSTTFKLGGWRYVKICTSAAQAAARTIELQGMRL
jgi:hypothetical protein